MTRAGSWRGHVTAFFIYNALSIAVVDHGMSLVENLSGQGSDPTAFVWFFAWLPYAVIHHLNPFYTHLLWCPLGVSLAWVTSVPVLAGLLAPVTLTAGPVAAYNVAIIAAPALSALAAFWLCWSLTSRFPAALIGGYLFGFSSYIMAQDTAAPNLSFAVCPPLLALVVLARLRGRLSCAEASATAAFVLAVQFFLSIEIAALSVLFGGVAWALAWLYRPDWRGRLQRLVIDGMITGLALLILLSPVLMQMLGTRQLVRLPATWHLYFTADLLNVIIPSRNNFWGTVWPFPLPAFNGGIQEQDAYIGLPLLLIIVSFARNAPAARWLVVLFIFLLIMSFGPFVWIGGWFSKIAAPWLIFSYLPLLVNALPARFALFVSLCACVIVALWLADGPKQRYVWAVLTMVTLAPALHPWEPIPRLRFFAPSEVQTVLGRDPQLLILPFAINAPSSYWQVESRFAFTQTGGYLGYPPAPMQAYPAVAQLFGNQVDARFPSDFARFAVSTGTQFVVLTAGTTPAMAAAIATLGWPTRDVDDVTILTVPHA